MVDIPPIQPIPPIQDSRDRPTSPPPPRSRTRRENSGAAVLVLEHLEELGAQLEELLATARLQAEILEKIQAGQAWNPTACPDCDCGPLEVRGSGVTATPVGDVIEVPRRWWQFWR